MAARWGIRPDARQRGLGAAQGIVFWVLPAVAFWVVLILLLVFA